MGFSSDPNPPSLNLSESLSWPQMEAHNTIKSTNRVVSCFFVMGFQSFFEKDKPDLCNGGFEIESLLEILGKRKREWWGLRMTLQ